MIYSDYGTDEFVDGFPVFFRYVYPGFFEQSVEMSEIAYHALRISQDCS